MDGRTERERDFHDHRFTDDPRVRLRGVYRAAAAGREWYRALAHEAGTDADALEVGCGGGGISRILGPVATSLIGIDVSQVAVDQARAYAATRRGAWRAEVSFRVMDAEQLDFADSSFDLVCGGGILHHVDVDRLAAETARVLRPGGTALFLEPLGHNPLINLFRRITPRLRSDDERPLLERDLAGLGQYFAEVSVERSALLTPLATPLMRWRIGGSVVRWLERADRWLIGRFEWAKRWAWMVVIVGTTSSPQGGGGPA